MITAQERQGTASRIQQRLKSKGAATERLVANML